MNRILITDSAHELLISELKSDGFEVDYLPEISPTSALEIIGDYHGLIINSRVPANREMLERAHKLKFVCRLGSGLEVIDLDFAKEKGIAAFNSPEGNKVAVAEHALGMLLCLMNNITIAHREVQQGKWNREPNRGEELSRKTVGLIAYGNNARSFARLLQGFDVNILAYDKYLSDFSHDHVRQATLQEIFDETDVLSLHLPLTPETHHIIDHKFLSSFKKKIWLLNTSRGKVMNTEHLLHGIREGKIKGAALDVLENEKLDTYSTAEKSLLENLLSTNKVIITPHIAGWTHESKKKIAEVLLEKIRALQIN